jgi:hypothetical protein
MKRTAALLAAVLAATPATAGQVLVPGPGGLRYAPAAPRYYPPYLQGYVRPWRPDPGAIIGGAIAGALATLPPPPVWYYAAQPAPRPDAIAEIRDPVTRGEVVTALERLCELEPATPICQKMSQQQSPR